MAGIFYYVSGHGYGHAVRSAQVISALRTLAPELPLWVRTTAPGWLFPTDTLLEPVQLDLGALQRGSLHVRRLETLQAFHGLMQSEEAQITREVQLARQREISCVVADIPSAAFEIAQRLNIPGIGVANFCWHWIYEPYAHRFPAYRHVVEHIRRQEHQATILLRLPFAWEFDCFNDIQDVPLIGRRAQNHRLDTRRRLAVSSNQQVALLSFGGFGLDQLSAERLARWSDWLFLTTDSARPSGRVGNIQNVSDSTVSYVDVMVASDAVVTKPGFGIVSDALVNHVPVLYSDRGEFREYGMLSRALRTHGRAKFIPRSALVNGELGPYLDRLRRMSKPWATMEITGAELIAKHILDFAVR
ncbi:MAG: hypothetical protein ACKVVP_04335 [Chloroflexota bacterium]